MGEMNDRELLHLDIDKYMNLQRILKAEDPKKEVMNQMKAVKASLEASGIVVENLTLE